MFSKAFLNKKNLTISYRSFIPFYLAFSAAAAVIVALFLVHSISISPDGLAYAALMGFIYTVAAYLVFYSLENEQVMIITTITSSQFIILSFLSAVIFIRALVLKDTMLTVLMLAGVILLSIDRKRKLKLSKFALLTFLGTVAWVIMWLIFYATIETGTSPFVYYTWLAIFAAIFSVVFSVVLGVKIADLKSPIKSRKLTSYMLSAGVASGVGTLMFSFAYSMNSVLSPLFTQISIPSVAILAFLLFRDRIKVTEIIGAAAIIVSVFLLVLA